MALAINRVFCAFDSKLDAIPGSTTITTMERIELWNSTILKKFSKLFNNSKEETLNKSVNDYYRVLKEQLTYFKQRHLLKDRIIDQVYVLHLMYISLQDQNLIKTSVYLDTMEKIVCLICELELEIITSTRNKQIAAVAQFLINLLDIYLFKDTIRIIHVLLKLSERYAEKHSYKLVMNLVYRQFLVTRPISDTADINFCRHYLIYQKWKKTKDVALHEQMDKCLFYSFNKSQNYLYESKVLRTILKPCETEVTNIVDDYVNSVEAKVIRYFKYFEQVKDLRTPDEPHQDPPKEKDDPFHIEFVQCNHFLKNKSYRKKRCPTMDTPELEVICLDDDDDDVQFVPMAAPLASTTRTLKLNNDILLPARVQTQDNVEANKPVDISRLMALCDSIDTSKLKRRPKGERKSDWLMIEGNTEIDCRLFKSVVNILKNNEMIRFSTASNNLESFLSKCDISSFKYTKDGINFVSGIYEIAIRMLHKGTRKTAGDSTIHIESIGQNESVTYEEYSKKVEISGLIKSLNETTNNNGNLNIISQEYENVSYHYEMTKRLIKIQGPHEAIISKECQQRQTPEDCVPSTSASNYCNISKNSIETQTIVESISVISHESQKQKEITVIDVLSKNTNGQSLMIDQCTAETQNSSEEHQQKMSIVDVPSNSASHFERIATCAIPNQSNNGDLSVTSEDYRTHMTSNDTSSKVQDITSNNDSECHCKKSAQQLPIGGNENSCKPTYNSVEIQTDTTDTNIAGINGVIGPPSSDVFEIVKDNSIENSILYNAISSTPIKSTGECSTQVYPEELEGNQENPIKIQDETFESYYSTKSSVSTSTGKDTSTTIQFELDGTNHSMSSEDFVCEAKTDGKNQEEINNASINGEESIKISNSTTSIEKRKIVAAVYLKRKTKKKPNESIIKPHKTMKISSLHTSSDSTVIADEQNRNDFDHSAEVFPTSCEETSQTSTRSRRGRKPSILKQSKKHLPHYCINTNAPGNGINISLRRSPISTRAATKRKHAPEDLPKAKKVSFTGVDNVRSFPCSPLPKIPNFVVKVAKESLVLHSVYLLDNKLIFLEPCIPIDVLQDNGILEKIRSRKQDAIVKNQNNIFFEMTVSSKDQPASSRSIIERVDYRKTESELPNLTPSSATITVIRSTNPAFNSAKKIKEGELTAIETWRGGDILQNIFNFYINAVLTCDLLLPTSPKAFKSLTKHLIEYNKLDVLTNLNESHIKQMEIIISFKHKAYHNIVMPFKKRRHSMPYFLSEENFNTEELKNSTLNNKRIIIKPNIQLPSYIEIYLVLHSNFEIQNDCIFESSKNCIQDDINNCIQEDINNCNEIDNNCVQFEIDNYIQDDINCIQNEIMEPVQTYSQSYNVEESYPAGPVISIAEVQESEQLQGRMFKTPAERKEFSEASFLCYPNLVYPETSSVLAEQYNVNNHTYNNPTINYQMGNVSVGVPVNVPNNAPGSIPSNVPTVHYPVNTPVHFPSATPMNFPINSPVNLTINSPIATPASFPVRVPIPYYNMAYYPYPYVPYTPMDLTMPSTSNTYDDIQVSRLQVRQIVESQPSCSQVRQIVENQPSCSQVRLIESQPSCSQVRQIIENQPSCSQVRLFESQPSCSQVRQIIENQPSCSQVRLIESQPSCSQVN